MALKFQRKFIFLTVYIFGLLLSLQFVFAKASSKEIDFDDAKKFLSKHLDLFDHKTIYCGCLVQKKTIDLNSCGYKIQKNKNRASRLEWEHVVPAEAFGNSFVEWREGTQACVKKGKKYKGRKCAGTNLEFRRMEGDLYNLFPEIGELNGLRSNYSMAQLTEKVGRFGNCAVKLADRKFEPSDSAKGIVARTYMHFENRYPGRGVVSGKNKKLFEAWDKMYPITEIECKRWSVLEKEIGYPHLFMGRCSEMNKQKR